MKARSWEGKVSRRSKISVDWVRHLTSEAERKEFTDTVLHDTLVLGRLRTILEDRIQSMETQEHSLSSYDLPSWGYKQAHLNGRKAELTAILKLLP